MRLDALLDDPELHLRLLAGAGRLDREVRQTITSDLLDPSRFLSGGELVLTGLMWWQRAGDTERFVSALAGADVAGLVVGSAGIDGLPDDLVSVCETYELPLFEVPVDFNFAVITEHVVLALAAERRLPFPAGADLVTGLAAVSAELAAGCLVVASTGRVVAGTAPLARGQVLARRYLAAERLPVTVQAPGLPTHSLLSAAEQRLASWFVAVEGDSERWSASQRQLVDRLVELVAAQRTAWMATLSASTAEAYVLATGPESGCAADVLAELGALLGPAIKLVESAGLTYAFAPAAGRTLAQAAGEVTEAIGVLERGLGDARLAIGISSAGMPEAADAWRLAVHRPGPASVALDTELTSHQLLLAAMPDELRTMFQHRLLGPLSAYDVEHRSSLVETLRVFLECNGSWNQAAERLHVHVNTLRYRLRRVEELTGRDLMSFPDRVDFHLALTL